MRRRRARRGDHAGQRADWAEGFANSNLRRLGVAVICAKVALVPLVFVYPLDAPFTVPKALLSHGLAWLLAGSLAALAIRFGPAFIARSWLHVPVLAFLAISAAATVFAADPYLALYGAHQRMLGLATLADWVVLYFGVALLVRSRAEAASVVGSGLVAAIAVLAYECIQLLGGDPFVWTDDVTIRPFSTIGQTTSLGQYLTILALGTLALGVFVERLQPATRAGLLLSAAAFLMGATATGTRSALLGMVFGSGVLLILTWLKHPSRRARFMSLAGGAAGTAGLALLLVVSPLGARLAQTVETSAIEDEDLLARLEPSLAARVALYAIALEMVRERPLLGYGPDNFVVGVPKYRTENEPPEIQRTLASSPHSWLFQVATGSGLVGLGAFVAMVAVAFALILRREFHSVTATSLVMLASFLGTGLTTISDIGTDWLLWVSLGAVAGGTAKRADASDDRTRGAAAHRRGTTSVDTDRAPLGRTLLASLSVTLALVLALAGVGAFDASRAARESVQARVGGRTAQGIDSGLRATRADSNRAEYWQLLGLAYVAARRWNDAITAFDRASQLAPYDVRHLGNQARAVLVLASAGDASARRTAIELAERAVRIDPNRPEAQLTRAIVRQATGDLTEALRSVQRALALDPESRSATIWITATQVTLASRSPDEAVRIARRGVGILGASRVTVPLRVELARALVASARPLEALTELEVALSIQPGDPAAVALRAEIGASLPGTR